MFDLAGSAEGPAIAIANFDKQIVFTSDGHLKLLGRRRSEVVGADWQNWMTPEDCSATLKRIIPLWETKQPYDILAPTLRKDGSIVPLVARCRPLRGQTSAEDLLFCEFYPLDTYLATPDPERFACASLVRDITYELARQAGRSRFSKLTNDLLAASASAEKAVEMLSRVADDLRIKPGLTVQP